MRQYTKYVLVPGGRPSSCLCICWRTAPGRGWADDGALPARRRWLLAGGDPEHDGGAYGQRQHIGSPPSMEKDRSICWRFFLLLLRNLVARLGQVAIYIRALELASVYGMCFLFFSFAEKNLTYVRPSADRHRRPSCFLFLLDNEKNLTYVRPSPDPCRDLAS
jgi:hypothetical protein